MIWCIISFLHLFGSCSCLYRSLATSIPTNSFKRSKLWQVSRYFSQIFVSCFNFCLFFFSWWVQNWYCSNMGIQSYVSYSKCCYSLHLSPCPIKHLQLGFSVFVLLFQPRYEMQLLVVSISTDDYVCHFFR